MTKVVRVPETVHAEATRLAALRGETAGDLMAEAWREYLATHKEEFAMELEHASQIIRNGTLNDLADYLSSSAKSRADTAAAAVLEGPGETD